MTKIAINGFERIGRSTFRRILDNHPASDKIIKEIKKKIDSIEAGEYNL